MTGLLLRAIGLVNSDVGHKDRARDIRAIESIALERKYQLVYVLTISAETYMPITAIAFEAKTREAVAVVAPSTDHFGEHWEKLAHAVTLETWARRIGRISWDPTR